MEFLMATSTLIMSKQVSSPPTVPEDLVSAIGLHAKRVFQDKQESGAQALQNEVDALTAKVSATAYEQFREQFDDLLRLLRNSYGQLARFVEGDFREQPSFYLGQLHALAELAHRLGHQRAPREAVELVARSGNAERILRRVVEEKSVGAAELATKLELEESNLSSTCKPLVEKELLRRDRFGKRVRYSPTPLTFSVLGQLTGKHSGQVDGAPERATVALSAEGTRDWPRVAVAAAANSLAPGQHVMANTDDFLSPLLTLAGVRGSDGIAIDPSGRTVSLEANNKGERTEFDLPKSVRKSLIEQLKACADFKRTEPSTIAGDVVDWSGQKLSFASKVADEGGAFTVQFLGIPDPEASKSKVQTAFQEIQEEKTRMIDFEKIYVREVLEGCEWKPSKAASTLGISRGRLDTLMKNLNLAP
jgi:DNA-binding MarR family transcriptional regulator